MQAIWPIEIFLYQLLLVDSIQTVLENNRVQEIVSDLSLIRVAQTYLGAKGICDLVTMWWWSTDFFDWDRIKFIKFLIDLTDVDLNMGPHCYVAKSHKTKLKNLRLIFQVEFCNSLFGQSYEPVRVSQNFKPEFVATVKQLKDTFSRFKVSEAQ